MHRGSEWSVPTTSTGEPASDRRTDLRNGGMHSARLHTADDLLHVQHVDWLAAGGLYICTIIPLAGLLVPSDALVLRATGAVVTYLGRAGCTTSWTKCASPQTFHTTRGDNFATRRRMRYNWLYNPDHAVVALLWGCFTHDPRRNPRSRRPRTRTHREPGHPLLMSIAASIAAVLWLMFRDPRWHGDPKDERQ